MSKTCLMLKPEIENNVCSVDSLMSQQVTLVHKCYCALHKLTNAFEFSLIKENRNASPDDCLWWSEIDSPEGDFATCSSLCSAQ